MNKQVKSSTDNLKGLARLAHVGYNLIYIGTVLITMFLADNENPHNLLLFLMPAFFLVLGTLCLFMKNRRLKSKRIAMLDAVFLIIIISSGLLLGLLLRFCLEEISLRITILLLFAAAIVSKLSDSFLIGQLKKEFEE